MIRDSLSFFLDFSALVLDVSGEFLDFLAWFSDLCWPSRDQFPETGRHLRVFGG